MVMYIGPRRGGRRESEFHPLSDIGLSNFPPPGPDKIRADIQTKLTFLRVQLEDLASMSKLPFAGEGPLNEIQEAVTKANGELRKFREKLQKDLGL